MLRFVWYGNFNFSSDLLVRAELSQIKWPSFPSRFHYFFFSLILFLFTGVCESRLLLWGFSDCANYWCFLRVQIEIISSCMLHVGASHLHLACLCHSAPFLSSTWLLACLWEFSVNDVGCWKLFLEFFWSERWKLTESQCRQQRVDKQENDVTNWNPFLRFSWDSAKHGCYYVRQRSGKIRVVFYEWQQKKNYSKRIEFHFHLFSHSHWKSSICINIAWEEALNYEKIIVHAWNSEVNIKIAPFSLSLSFSDHVSLSLFLLVIKSFRLGEVALSLRCYFNVKRSWDAFVCLVITDFSDHK